MADHFSQIKKLIFHSAKDLKSLVLNQDTEAANIVDLREHEQQTSDKKQRVFRVFLEADDTNNLLNTGWVLNEGVAVCLQCSLPFSQLSRWRHHCRGCGNLVCNHCCEGRALIESHERIGIVRVCKQCFRPGEKKVTPKNNRTLGSSLLPIKFQKHIIVDDSPAVIAVKGEFAASNVQFATPFSSSSSQKEKPIPSSFDLVPFPGFVIKTRRAGFCDVGSLVTVDRSDEKVFVNVFHHSAVIDPELKLLRGSASNTLSSASTTTSDSTINNGSNAQEEEMLPPIYLAAPRATADKQGAESTLYVACISTAYFKDNKRRDIDLHKNPAVVQKIIEAINKTFKDSLLESAVSLPNIHCGYKGDPVLQPEQFKLVTQPVSVELRVTSEGSKKKNPNVRPLATIVKETAKEAEQAATEKGQDKNNQISAAENKQQHQITTAHSPIANAQSSATQTAVVTYTHSNANSPGPSELVTRDSLSFFNAPPSFNNVLPPGTPLPPQSRHKPLTQHGEQRNKKSSPDSPHSDTHSVSEVSDTSMVSGASTMSRVVSLFNSATEKYGPEGKDYLTQEMLLVKKDFNLTFIEASKLIVLSTKNPTALLGWQIFLTDTQQRKTESEVESGTVYVVTGLRKNALRKTEFRLSRLDRPDCWTKLQRGESKGGAEFKPLRKVLNFASA